MIQFTAFLVTIHFNFTNSGLLFMSEVTFLLGEPKWLWALLIELSMQPNAGFSREFAKNESNFRNLTLNMSLCIVNFGSIHWYKRLFVCLHAHWTKNNLIFELFGNRYTQNRDPDRNPRNPQLMNQKMLNKQSNKHWTAFKWYSQSVVHKFVKWKISSLKFELYMQCRTFLYASINVG